MDDTEQQYQSMVVSPELDRLANEEWEKRIANSDPEDFDDDDLGE